MLAPQYSLRRLLALVTLSGFVCLIVAAAAQGRLWGVAVAISMCGFAVTIVVYAASYLLIRLVGGVSDRRQQRPTNT
jgi:hypothetical protein